MTARMRSVRDQLDYIEGRWALAGNDTISLTYLTLALLRSDELLMYYLSSLFCIQQEVILIISLLVVFQPPVSRTA